MLRVVIVLVSGVEDNLLAEVFWAFHTGTELDLDAGRSGPDHPCRQASRDAVRDFLSMSRRASSITAKPVLRTQNVVQRSGGQQALQAWSPCMSIQNARSLAQIRVSLSNRTGEDRNGVSSCAWGITRAEFRSICAGWPPHCVSFRSATCRVTAQVAASGSDAGSTIVWQSTTRLTSSGANDGAGWRRAAQALARAGVVSGSLAARWTEKLCLPVSPSSFQSSCMPYDTTQILKVDTIQVRERTLRHADRTDDDELRVRAGLAAVVHPQALQRRRETGGVHLEPHHIVAGADAQLLQLRQVRPFTALHGKACGVSHLCRCQQSHVGDEDQQWRAGVRGCPSAKPFVGEMVG